MVAEIPMGCPVKKIARKGGGSGLIRDPAQEIGRAHV
jgi:tRNA-dihydrouridine synthase